MKGSKTDQRITPVEVNIGVVIVGVLCESTRHACDNPQRRASLARMPRTSGPDGVNRIPGID